MEETLKGLEFDPGFAPYLMDFSSTIEYLYMDINRFKNFGQKKMKFLQYHKKMLQVLNNSIGFYIGCLMWASYIKTEPKQEILSNHCFGKEYNESANTAETQYILKFLEMYPRDMKYFLAQNYTFDENIINLVKVYEEFLVINKGFVESKYNKDIKIPETVKTTDAKNYKEEIEKVLKTNDLSNLIEYLPTII